MQFNRKKLLFLKKLFFFENRCISDVLMGREAHSPSGGQKENGRSGETICPGKN